MKPTFNRVARDSVLDTLRVSRFVKTPIVTQEGNGAPVGSVYFDNTTNAFYGNTLSGPVQLSASIVAVIPAGVTPAGMAILPNGSKLYVANNNNYGIDGQDSVTVIDVATKLPITTIYSNEIDTFNQPYTVTAATDGSVVYVTNSGGTTVSVIDTTADAITARVSGFDGPSGLVIKGTTAYVNNYGAGGNSGLATTVRVVNLLTNTITGPAITVDLAPAALCISPDLSKVYVACYTTGDPGVGTIRIINTSTNLATTTITGLSGPFGIAITPDGTKLYVTNFGSNNFAPFGTTVSVISTATNTIVATINAGIQPSGVAISPDGSQAVISNYNTLYAVGAPTYSNLTAGQGTIALIDTVTDTIAAPMIGVGQSPDAIVYSPNGEWIFVSNYTSGTVSVLTGNGRQ